MKKIFLPVVLFIIGLVVANIYFGLDIEKLIEGFLDFITEILDGPG